LRRISESRNTECFVLTSFFQLMIMAFFYLRLWNRSYNLVYLNYTNNDTMFTTNCTSLKRPSLETSIFVMEVFLLILYQVFQFNFAINAVVNQYVTQIIAIAVMNGIVSLYGFV
ncbi:30163_t:CDS:2, partial [Racocetra persica]